MSADWKTVARSALEGSETDSMSFPEGVKLLIKAGFDGYTVDFRRSVRTYYRPDGETFELAAEPTQPVAERFDAATVREAIREAQSGVAGYTYRGFCAKVAQAGCAGYLVSFPGRRVLYFGRTAETHTELFPGAAKVD
ncbi:DUF1398 domain-containing protein [Kaistia geumhonensis]|uniref:Uncharacterized protein YbcV (DUF1398 family) n=1 Tax=Kaistia geumhonensis TaxID=410839 RepID=A0ABU0MC15_9HYPH|nr:DUF1398 domain-containing protein [Kaistia geumhonensis]MCX5481435.1 DUF1398 domain-containing protein [Kaistia geumhonensis]MDQ0518500.1 uncharacterized protein YbcV (DUF1398 family) [Kaistia geumhonensis]